MMNLKAFQSKLLVNRGILAQVGLGLLFGGISIAFLELFRPWIYHAPYSSLVLPILGAYVLGVGTLSGILTSFVVGIYAIGFIPYTGLVPYFIFLVAATLVALVVRNTKQKIQRLSEAQIRAEESVRLKFAATAGKLGIWEWDIPEDKIVWDDQMLAFLGLERKDLTGTINDWHRSLHPDDFQKANELVKRALQNEAFFTNQFRIIKPNGEVRTLQSQGLIMRDEKGLPLKTFGLTRDITEEREAAQKIQELNAYLEMALDQSQAGIVIVEAKTGAIRFANKAALEISQRPEKELLENVDQSRYDVWHVADIHGKLLKNEEYPVARSLSGGDFIREELAIIRPSGEKRIVLTHSAPIRGADGSIIAAVAVFLDAIEQHQLLQEVKKAKKEAIEAMQAKARFLDVAAHELRTPVTAASLIIQLAQRQAQKGLAPDQIIFDRMKIQIDRLSRLVVDLLEVSKLDRGLLELKYELTDLKDLIQDCISNFQIQFPNRPILFSAPPNAVQEMVDPVRIYEVISNLIDNAIKYTSESSPIEISLTDDSEKIHFTIRDHGKGVSKKFKKRLFAAFERENSSPHKRYSGLGLGLFISREIIELHGGAIGLKSSGEQGSTFFFEIPKRELKEKTGTHA